MDSYLLFLAIAVVTVMSPGPGVVLTLSNSICYGLKSAIAGILGIATGTFFISALSATGLGLLLITSATAFGMIKWVGALYLLYLGVRLWRSPVFRLDVQEESSKSLQRHFYEGLAIQLTNPKAIAFFASVFPQFTVLNGDHTKHFFILVTTYSLLVVVIHLIYASLARSTRSWFTSGGRGHWLNRISGGFFILFGVGLASSSR